MTVDRNKILLTKLWLWVISITSFKRKVLEKSNTSYIDIIESTPRNTAAAIAFAAFASAPDDILIVTPSDHIIGNADLYEQSIQEAIEKQVMVLL
jgi:mannose-1-phosphate guanylyltransferase